MSKLYIFLLSAASFVTVSINCSEIVETHYCTIKGARKTFAEAGITQSDILKAYNARPERIKQLEKRADVLKGELDKIIARHPSDYQSYIPSRLNTEFQNISKKLQQDPYSAHKAACEAKGGTFSIETKSFGPARQHNVATVGIESNNYNNRPEPKGEGVDKASWYRGPQLSTNQNT